MRELFEKQIRINKYIAYFSIDKERDFSLKFYKKGGFISIQILNLTFTFDFDWED